MVGLGPSAYGVMDAVFNQAPSLKAQLKKRQSDINVMSSVLEKKCPKGEVVVEGRRESLCRQKNYMERFFRSQQKIQYS